MRKIKYVLLLSVLSLLALMVVVHRKDPRSFRPSVLRLSRSRPLDLIPLRQSPQQKSGEMAGTPVTRALSQEEAELLFQILRRRSSPHRVKVLILTYMRSGSSFVGDLLHTNPGTFYMYEPLLSLDHSHRNAWDIRYLDGRVQKATGNLQQKAFQAMDTLRAVMSCRFQDLSVDMLHQDHMYESNDTRPFYSCAMKNSGIPNLRGCLRRLWSRCLNSKVTVLKVIRMSMSQAGRLMAADPDVKVIHLIRDPRGMMFSQMRVGEFDWRNMSVEVKPRCSRILADVYSSLHLSSLHPGRILTVRYEDIAARPVASAHWMHQWLGLRMDQKERDYIFNITHGVNDSCAICTTRKNATETANFWMRYMYMQQLDAIQTACFRLMHFMGYRRFLSIGELDQFVPPTLEDFSDKFLKIDLKTYGDKDEKL